MDQGTIITIDMVIKPELADAVCAGIPDMFKDTVKMKGFRSIRAVRHKDQPNRVKIIEHWDREEDYQAYQDWRKRNGPRDAEFARLESFQYDVWPAYIGSAEL